MKNLSTLFIFLAFAILAYADENNSSNVTATKLCSDKTDIFNATTIEDVVSLPKGEKLATYRIILQIPAKNGDSKVFKYNSNQQGGFKGIMDEVKEHFVPGSLLLVDEMKATTGDEIPFAAFYLH